MIARFSFLGAALLAAPACDRSAPTPADAPPAASVPIATALPSSATVSSAGPRSSSSAAAPAAPIASGSWSATFDVKRVSIQLPAETPWPAWKKDGGKQLGAMTLELDIDEGGGVKGRASGALGGLVISGRFEDGSLRAGVTPEDPTADDAMTGTLTGRLRGAPIEATIRVSSRTGQSVRGAEFKLERRANR